MSHQWREGDAAVTRPPYQGPPFNERQLVRIVGIKREGVLVRGMDLRGWFVDVHELHLPTPAELEQINALIPKGTP